MLPFAIGALRAIVEMLGLCLLGMGAMALLAGAGRQGNPVYRLFELITRAPRQLVARLLPELNEAEHQLAAALDQLR